MDDFENKIESGFQVGIDATIKAAKGEQVPDSQLKAGMFLTRLKMQNEREKGVNNRFTFQKMYQMAKDFIEKPEDRIKYIKESNPSRINPPDMKLLSRPKK